MCVCMHVCLSYFFFFFICFLFFCGKGQDGVGVRGGSEWEEIIEKKYAQVCVYQKLSKPNFILCSPRNSLSK